MTTALIIALLALDVVLLVALVLIGRKQTDHTDTIRELTEERTFLTELRSSIQEDLTAAKSQNKEILEKVSHIAAEAEQEIKSGGATISKDVEGVVTELTEKFQDPLRELNRKQASLEKMYRKLVKEKNLLLKALSRSEKVCEILATKGPYDQVLEDLQSRKYADARSMLTQGYSADQVGRELGLSTAEVKLLVGMT